MELPPNSLETQASPPLRRLRQFSLLNLLMVATVVCFASAYFYIWRQLASARQELLSDKITIDGQHRRISQLQAELGAITVTDPTKVHILMLQTHDSQHWKWRVYWPGTARPSCSVRLAVGAVPASGFNSAPTDTINFGLSGEMTVEALLRRDPQGTPVFTVQVPGQGKINRILTNQQADELSSGGNITLSGVATTEIVSQAGPIQLLRDQSFQPDGFGVLLWMQ